MNTPKAAAAKLVEYIELKILSGDYPPGDQLPSIRRLAAKFDLNYSAAYRTLNELAALGVLLRDDSGAFRAGRLQPVTKSPTRKLAFIEEGKSEKPTGLLGSAVLGIRDELRDKEFELDEIPIHPINFSQSRLTELGREYDGLFLLNSYDWYLSSFECACPAVGMLMLNSYGGRLSLFNLDPFDAALQAREYFMRIAGVRNVMIVSSTAPAFRVRGKVFQFFWEEIGGKVLFLDGDFPADYNYPDDWGYFFTSDSRAQSAMQNYTETTGRNLSSDHPVLSIDGKNILAPELYAFPSIGIDWRQLGRLMCRELLRKLEDPLALSRNLLLPGKLRYHTESENHKNQATPAEK